MIHCTQSPEETRALAKTLAETVKRKGCVVCLFGDLGTGKTTFAKGFAEGLGISENEVRSPTFTMVHPYELEGGNFYHCDLYRLGNGIDAVLHALSEYFEEENAVTIIEWADRIKKYLPVPRMDIHFLYTGDKTREIRITIVPHDKTALKN